MLFWGYLSCWSNGRTVDVVALQRLSDEAGSFHLFHKRSQESGCFRAPALWGAHSLLNHHKAFIEQAQTADLSGVVLQLLLHAGSHFGSFLEEKHKPAFYDAAVSYVHPPLGLFPHINPGEYFVWGGMLVALLDLEKRGVIANGYHVKVAIWYAIVGLVVILLKGILTERITAIMARRQGVEL